MHFESDKCISDFNCALSTSMKWEFTQNRLHSVPRLYAIMPLKRKIPRTTWHLIQFRPEFPADAIYSGTNTTWRYLIKSRTKFRLSNPSINYVLMLIDIENHMEARWAHPYHVFWTVCVVCFRCDACSAHTNATMGAHQRHVQVHI